MKLILLYLAFLIMPYILLTNYVLPSLETLQHFYGNIEVIAQNAVDEQGTK